MTGHGPHSSQLGDKFNAVSSSLILFWQLWVRIPENLPNKVVNCVVLCIVRVYFTTATGCQPKLQVTNISYHIIYHIISYIISYHISYHISYNISYHIMYHIVSYIISYHISYRIISYHISYRIISYHISYRIIISYHFCSSNFLNTTQICRGCFLSVCGSLLHCDGYGFLHWTVLYVKR
jgi:hypothetical protein